MSKKPILILVLVLLAPATYSIDVNSSGSLQYYSGGDLDFEVDTDGQISAKNSLNMNGNSVTNFFGSACQNGRVVDDISDDGTFNCVDPVEDIQTENLSKTLTAGNVANQSIDMSENAIQNISALQDDTTDTLRFDGSNNVEVPNGNLSLTDVASSTNGEPVRIWDDDSTLTARFTDGNNVQVPNGNVEVIGGNITFGRYQWGKLATVERSSYHSFSSEYPQNVLIKNTQGSTNQHIFLGDTSSGSSNTVLGVGQGSTELFDVHGTGDVEVPSGSLLATGGDVGVGTDNPDSIFHIRDSSGPATGDMVFNATVSSGYDAEFELNDVGLHISHSSSARDIQLQTADTTGLKIDGSQNVQIPNGNLRLTGMNGIVFDGNTDSQISYQSDHSAIEIRTGSDLAMKFWNGAAIDVGKNMNMKSNKIVFNSGDVRIGDSATSTSGTDPTAVGKDADATDNYAAAFGKGATASNVSSVAIGRNSDASSKYGIGIGGGSYANTGWGGIAIGYNAGSTASHAIAVGRASSASGSSSLSHGAYSEASGSSSTAVGQGSSATSVGATALGMNADATGYNSVAIGYKAKSPNNYEVTLGNLGSQRLDANITGKTTMHSNLDLKQNEAKNMVLDKRTSDPSNPETGQMWYRTDKD